MSDDKLLAAETVEVQEEVCSYQLEITLVKKQEVLKKSNLFNPDLSAANAKDTKKTTFEKITPPASSSSTSVPFAKNSDTNYEEFNNLLEEGSQPPQQEAATPHNINISPLILARTR